MARFIFTSVLLLSWALNVPLLAKPFTVYVATDGNDQWSGVLIKPASNGKDGPLRTLPAALAAAKAAWQDPAKSKDGVTILLRGGSHALSEPVVITPEMGGCDARRLLTIAACGEEKPVLTGGRKVTGWQPVADKVNWWQAEVPGVKEGKVYFRQLFVNGQRKQRARTPNDGFLRIDGKSPQDKPVKIQFKAGDIKKEWADDGDVEVIALLAWADLRMQIRAVDETERVATLSGNPQPSNREDNAQYYVENAPDALDQPGEWYLNRRTGIVTYIARPGEDPSKADVVAPVLTDLLFLRGDLSGKRPVQHVVLRGLTFSETDWTLGANGYADTQAAINIHGNVLAEGTVDCMVEGCTFTRLAGYAMEFGRGCQRNRFVGNHIYDVGGGGVRLGETQVRQEASDQNHHQLVTDNHMHDLGVIYPAAVGVFILQSGQNRVAHNHIHHLYYTAVSVGWNWGYQETPCRENIIEFNHLHDIGQFRLSDMGAVYTLGIQKGTAVRNNLVHDVNSFTYGGWGLYTDEGSTDIVLENNVVYRTKSAGFHQHYGRDNVVRNNVFAFGRENQVMRSRAEAHISFTFTNNIVYFDSGNLLGSNWSNDNYRMDGNVYWDGRPGANLASKGFAGVTLQEWRKRGHDVHSMVADPLFVNPASFDFRLKRDSPALSLGFKPIDVSRVGVRKRAEWGK